MKSYKPCIENHNKIHNLCHKLFFHTSDLVSWSKMLVWLKMWQYLICQNLIFKIVTCTAVIFFLLFSPSCDLLEASYLFASFRFKFKVGLFNVWLDIKLVLKYQRKKGTICMVCIVYRTFLIICECDTEELGVGRTCGCPMWFSVSNLLFINCFFLKCIAYISWTNSLCWQCSTKFCIPSCT